MSFGDGCRILDVETCDCTGNRCLKHVHKVAIRYVEYSSVLIRRKSIRETHDVLVA